MFWDAMTPMQHEVSLYIPFTLYNEWSWCGSSLQRFQLWTIKHEISQDFHWPYYYYLVNRSLCEIKNSSGNRIELCLKCRQRCAHCWPGTVRRWQICNTLRWRHNGRDSVSTYQPHHCLLNRLLSCRSKKTSKLLVTGLCEGNSPGTGEFPAQMASNAENVSIWWRHHDQL